MIANLMTAKAQLSDIVDRASRGEEVWVTVRGKPKVRMTALPNENGTEDGKERWFQSVREIRAKYGRQRVAFQMSKRSGTICVGNDLLGHIGDPSALC